MGGIYSLNEQETLKENKRQMVVRFSPFIVYFIESITLNSYAYCLTFESIMGKIMSVLIFWNKWLKAHHFTDKEVISTVMSASAADLGG